MTASTPIPFSRRDLLKGGGALMVGFSIRGAAARPVRRAARGTSPVRRMRRQVDSWIAIHADNTATIYFGKVELGQGNTTGMLQIAGEELDLDMSQLIAVRVDTNVTPNQGADQSRAPRSSTAGRSCGRGGRGGAAGAAATRRGPARRAARSLTVIEGCRFGRRRAGAAPSSTANWSATSRST